MLAEMLDPQVSAVEAFDDTLDTPLFPAEEALLGRAVEKRRREFTTTRACARTALARLGIPPAPIIPGVRGAPQWPPGIVGSMTHCAGYRACAVAREQDIITIGVDAEPDDCLPDGILDAIIATADERARVSALKSSAPWPSWDRLLFSAKESVYKAWFPLTQRWLDFGEAVVTIDPVGGTFTADLLVSGPILDDRALTGFTGRWLARSGLVLTAIAVPRGAPPQ